MDIVTTPSNDCR